MPLADAGALSHVRQQLIARVGVAEIDLRALAAAALAVSPFFVWNMVDRLADPYQRYETTASLIVGQVQLAEGLILTTFGYVFVALGWALYRQRKAKRLLPFAFVAASLGVATLLAVLSAAVWGVHLLDLSRYGTSDYVVYLKQNAVLALVLNNAALFATVGVAARLYVGWRRVPADPLDSLRFAALTVITLVFAAVSFVSWVIGVWSRPAVSGAPSPITALWSLQEAATSLVESAGAVFLYGFMAIAALKRAQVEDRLGWVTAAALGASIASWLMVHGPSLAEALQMPDQYLIQLSLSALLSPVSGLIAGPIYLYVVHPRAFQEALADFPTSLEELRRWPDRDDGRET